MTLFEPAQNRKQLSGQLIFFLTWLAITGFGIFLHASPTGHGTHEELGLPPCPSVLLFNRPCPGCGLTTSWTAFIHGNFAFAFHAHPLGPPLYILFTLGAWLAFRGWLTKGRLLVDTPQVNRALMIGVVIFICFGLVRMALTPHYRTLQDIAAMR